jgi:hypothetical protein
MEYFSTLKGNELSKHEMTWQNIECLLLSNEANLKRCLLYNSNYVACQNFGDKK